HQAHVLQTIAFCLDSSTNTDAVILKIEWSIRLADNQCFPSCNGSISRSPMLTLRYETVLSNNTSIDRSSLVCNVESCCCSSFGEIEIELLVSIDRCIEPFWLDDNSGSSRSVISFDLTCVHME